VNFCTRNLYCRSLSVAECTFVAFDVALRAYHVTRCVLPTAISVLSLLSLQLPSPSPTAPRPRIPYPTLPYPTLPSPSRPIPLQERSRPTKTRSRRGHPLASSPIAASSKTPGRRCRSDPPRAPLAMKRRNDDKTTAASRVPLEPGRGGTRVTRGFAG
jgi:hypothetical protein